MGSEMRVEIRNIIHTTAVGLAVLCAFFLLIDSVAGWGFAEGVERNTGQKLIKLANDPQLHEEPTSLFLDGEDPQMMYKGILACVQISQRVLAEFIVFLFLIGLVRLTRHKDTPAVNRDTKRPSRTFIAVALALVVIVFLLFHVMADARLL
jgi:hypothetical protein